MDLYRYGDYVLDELYPVNKVGRGWFTVVGKIIGGSFRKSIKRQSVELSVSSLQPFELPDALLSNDFQGACRNCGLPVGHQTAGVKCPGCGEMYSFKEWFHIVFATCDTNI